MSYCRLKSHKIINRKDGDLLMMTRKAREDLYNETAKQRVCTTRMQQHVSTSKNSATMLLNVSILLALLIFSACPKSLLAAGSEWTEIEINGQLNGANLRLWSATNPDRLRKPTPGLVNFAIWVSAEDKCRTVSIKPKLNQWSRSAMPIGNRIYRTGYYQIGFLAPIANTLGALGREQWTINATVSDVQECPS